jgi:hypothetical protein
LAERDISGNDFSITERGILEEWDVVAEKIERVKALLK